MKRCWGGSDMRLNESGSYGRRPKCRVCGTALSMVFMRNGTYRYNNLGYYCKFCKGVYINDDIKIMDGPLYIGLEQVKK